MLDGLLGRGFSSKCKSSIKLTNDRIDVIRRKRNATQKFLKKDIVDLLKNGLDIHAYGRAEGLLVELNISSCYDFVEQFCGCVLRQLSVMRKHRECPEECTEAVSSLMFAAARFADLPELRDLRNIFTERYGNSLESVNQEFVEKLASKPPSLDKKLQLMQDIAQEFSIKWDSKAFEQKISNPLASERDQHKNHGSFYDHINDGYIPCNSRDDTAPKRESQDVSPRGRRELVDYGYKPQNGREERGETDPKRINQGILSRGRWELTDDSYKPQNDREETVLKRDNHDISSHGVQELTDDGYKSRNGGEETVLKREKQGIFSHGRREFTNDGFKPRHAREDTIPKRDNLGNSSRGRIEHVDDGYRTHSARVDTVHRRDNLDISSRGRWEFAPGYTTRQQAKLDSQDIPVSGNNHNGPPYRADSIKRVSEEEAENMKPHYSNLIPPYVKPNGGKYGTRHASSDHYKAPTDPPVHKRDVAIYRSERTQTGSDCIDYERQFVGSARMNGCGGKNDHHHQDDLVDDMKLKPRSVNRRHLKSSPGHDIVKTECDEVVKRNVSGRRRENARRGLQHALDDDRDLRDQEEKMMDRLLMHYSKKSALNPAKVRAGLKAPPSHSDVADAGKSARYQSSDAGCLNLDRGPPPARAVSLPPKPAFPTDAGRGPARATSFEPKMLNPAGHVHPKLPDYDDLAVQFAAMRGR